MHDVGRVRGRERVRELARDARRLARSEQTARAQPRRERLADEEIHHEVGRAVLEGSEIADRDDRGVPDGRRRARLLEESGSEPAVGGEIAPEDLHREHAVERDVADLVDRTHAAFAERRDHLVALIDRPCR